MAPDAEWVELFNTLNDTVLADAFSLSDNSGTKAPVPGINIFLPAGGYFVIADDSSFFRFHDATGANVSVVSIPSLNNTGDAVVIRDASGNVIDSVGYSPSWGGNTGGKSLERILAAGNSNEAQNYESSTDSSGSTPGKINSVSPRDHDLAVSSISSYPPHPRVGDVLRIMLHVVNNGLKRSGSSTAYFFRDANLDGKMGRDEYLGSEGIQELAPGDSAAITFLVGSLGAGVQRIGIMVDLADEERPQDNSGFADVGVGLPPASVVINEIMYAPKGTEQEWLELYNAGYSDVDLSGFKVTTHGGSATIPNGPFLTAHDYAVICRDSSASTSHYPIRHLITRPCPSLGNGGDRVQLQDNFGNVLDTAVYDPSLGGANGRSLERIDYLEGSGPANWRESVDSTGATPGTENSVAVLPCDIAVKRLDLPQGVTNVGDACDMSFIILNAGRNTAAGFSARTSIVRTIDSSEVFSEIQADLPSLAAKDSLAVRFIFSPDRPGHYRVKAETSMPRDTRMWNDTCSGILEVSFEQQALAINEIMYSSGKSGEYFELLNGSPSEIDLSGWTFQTHSPDARPVCSGGHVLGAGQYFVVGADSAILGFLSDTNAVNVCRAFSLRDDGDCLVIRDPGGTTVDSVSYYPSWHNKDIASTAGRSLEKINPSLPSNDRSSWSTCVSSVGGTPGSKNSLYLSAGQTAGSIGVTPNPFSPDGDGHDDFTFIEYSFPVTSVKIRTRVYDSLGRLIATPADNIVVPSKGRLVWDGRDASGKIVRFGLYILFVEVTGPDGNSIATYKAPLVVAKRMR